MPVSARNWSAQNPYPVFQDLSATSSPAAGDALNVGVYPPPVYNGTPGPATVTPGYAQPNILMIMVDQLRSPRWLPRRAGLVDQLLPISLSSANIRSTFRTTSWQRPTAHPPATLLTGLYSQQTTCC